MRALLAFVAIVFVTAGCGGGNGSPKCIAGDSKSCTGPEACAGYQVCRADGVYDPCICGGGGTGGTGGAAAATGGTGGAGGRGGAAGTGGDGGRGGAGGRGGFGGTLTCVYDAAPPDAAASDDAAPDRPAADGPALDPQFKAFCDAVRGTMVARHERCSRLPHRFAVALVSRDPCDVWGAAIAAGTMRFDATNATACAAALGTLSCHSTTRPSVCAGVLEGLVPYDYRSLGMPYSRCQIGVQLRVDGEVNASPVSFLFSDCAPGNFCTAGIGLGIAGAGCSGACVPLPAEGGSCDAFTPCAAGLVCNTTGGCGALPSSPCRCAQPQVENGDCRARICGDDLYCDGTVCKPRYGTGACSPERNGCRLPAICVPDLAGGPGASACGTPTLSPGNCCGGVDQCAGGICGTDHACHALPFVGESCEGTLPCLIGLCGGDAGACMTQPMGGYCVNSASCGPQGMCMWPRGGMPQCGTCP